MATTHHQPPSSSSGGTVIARSSPPLLQNILQNPSFSKLPEIHTQLNLQRALSLANVSEIGGVSGVVGVGLNAWGESDLKSLRDELDVSKVTLSELNRALQEQIDSWEKWKALQGHLGSNVIVEFKVQTNSAKRVSIPTPDMKEWRNQQIQEKTKQRNLLNPPTPTILSNPTTPVLSAKKKEPYTPHIENEDEEIQEEGDFDVDIEGGEDGNLGAVKEEDEREESEEEEDGGEYYEEESDKSENDETVNLQNQTPFTKRRGATKNKNRKHTATSGGTRRSKAVQKNSSSPTPLLTQQPSPTSASVNSKKRKKRGRDGRDEDDYYPSSDDFSQTQGTQEDSQQGPALEEEEPETKIAPAVGANIFWQSMEAYFRPINEQDLKFISPTVLKDDDPSFIIPPLGPYYSQIWAAEDAGEIIDKRYKNSAGYLVRKPIINDDSYTFEGDDNLTDREDVVVVGDFTQRVLQALLEENLVINHPPSPPLSEEEKTAKSNGSDILANSEGPLPPLYSYTKSGMYTFEERIKMELKDIGLFEVSDDLESMFGGGYGVGGGEDDEICTELRVLHKQLRDRVALNNTRKQEILKHLQSFLQRQEMDLKKREEGREVEQKYLKIIRKKKGGRGRWKSTPTHTSSVPTPVSNPT